MVSSLMGYQRRKRWAIQELDATVSYMMTVQWCHYADNAANRATHDKGANNSRHGYGGK